MARGHVDTRRVVSGALAAGLALWCMIAQAHGISIFALTDGTDIRGYVQFAGGKGAAGMTVTAHGPDGAELGTATADDNGDFVFTPSKPCDHRFVVDTGDGHRAEYVVRVEELPAGLAGGLEDAAAGGRSGAIDARTLEGIVEKAVSAQVAPLRKQLAEHEDKVRLREIVGGIGYIVGVTGLLAFVMGRRRGIRQNSDR